MKSIRLRVSFLALLLVAITLALFYPATSFSLVNFDDPVFIVHNPIIFNGFSGNALRSAFTGLHGDECMYVPLLWVSYLLDLKFFNASPVDPWGFHFSNVLIHAFNSALLFLLLFAFCKKPWRAFFFAALWALHPLRVESVAWVTSRKDVLSTFFALLSVGAYVWAATRNTGAKGTAGSSRAHSTPGLSRPFYGASFLFFLLGLLVKPMLVTIPCLMLLLDFWPLRRYGSTGPAAARAVPRLLLEKLPFFLGAGLASLVVYLTQTHAMGSAPLWFRLYCIPSNYLFYLAKSFLPFRLSAMVPREPISILSFLLAVGILAAVSAWTWARRRERPNELAGWLAFLGLLFPVIGIVLIGIYPVAERYSYLPSIGLSVALLYLLPSGPRRPRKRLFRAGRLGLALTILAALAVLTSRHLPSWRNNQSLYDNVARQHPGHYAAIYHQAQQAFFVKGDVAAADQMADRLLQIKPETSFGLVLKIVCLSQRQSTEAALEFAQAHYPPVDVLTNPGIYENYLAILALLARRYDLANQYMRETFRRSVFEPKSQEQLHALAMFLAHELGDEATALDHAARISALQNKTQLAPEDFFLSYTTIWAAGLYAQMLPRFQELARTYPDRPDLLNNVAWLLATTAGSPAAPEEILGMVRQALSNAPQHPVILDTLSVAQAYAGDYDAALQTAQQLAAVLAISPAADAPSMLRKVQKRIDLYRERQPFREDSSGRLLYAP